MKCYQCGRPAMYRVGENNEVPLCLDCFRKACEIANLEFLKAAATANQALDRMDAIIPVGPISARIPVAELARAMQKGSTYNNIRMSKLPGRSSEHWRLGEDRRCDHAKPRIERRTHWPAIEAFDGGRSCRG